MGVLQLYANFYEQCALGEQPKVGDIYWVPVPVFEAVPRLLDVKRSDPTAHTTLDFEICQVRPGHHFTARPDRLPIKLLTLEATEELLISKGKRRPALVLIAPDAVDNTAFGAEQKRITAVLARRSYIVAPFYSVATPNAPNTMVPQFVARVRTLRYPQFCCLPPLGSNESKPGQIVRMDHLLATALGRGSQSTGWRLHADLLDLVLDQFRWVASGCVSENLQLIIDTVAEALPVELR